MPQAPGVRAGRESAAADPPTPVRQAAVCPLGMRHVTAGAQSASRHAPATAAAVCGLWRPWRDAMQRSRDPHGLRSGIGSRMAIEIQQSDQRRRIVCAGPGYSCGQHSQPPPGPPHHVERQDPEIRRFPGSFRPRSQPSAQTPEVVGIPASGGLCRNSSGINWRTGWPHKHSAPILR